MKDAQNTCSREQVHTGCIYGDAMPHHPNTTDASSVVQTMGRESCKSVPLSAGDEVWKAMLLVSYQSASRACIHKANSGLQINSCSPKSADHVPPASLICCLMHELTTKAHSTATRPRVMGHGTRSC